jgi:tungstate transport system ATP-binding protein
MTNPQTVPAHTRLPDQSRIVDVKNLTVQKMGQVICNVSALTVAKGERIGVTGSNGSGKTTLLRVLAGLEKDFTGVCEIATAPAERVFVHQSPFLFSGTVLDNVEYGLRARSLSKSDRKEQAAVWLKRLGLCNLANRSTRSLSGGEGRRTAIARACVLQPRLLLLDEPLADLDPAGIECVQQSLNALPNTTILLSSPTPLPDGFVDRTITPGPSSSHEQLRN